MSRPNRWIGVLILLGSLTLGSFAWEYQVFLRAPLALPERTPYVVPPGTSLAALVGDLEARGWLEGWSIVPRRVYLLGHARWNGYAGKIQAGEYALVPGVTGPELLRQLTSGAVLQHELAVIEGWTVRQLLQALAAHGAIRVTLEGAGEEALMRAIGAPGEAAEGRFFPDTYRFPRGTTDVDFLRRAYRRMSEELDRAWAAREEGLPLRNPAETLVLASIIEKETGLASERAEIAGVFVRRLRKGMRLQTDPTVIYGLGEAFDGNLRRVHLETDTPYNTYTRAGLPPTPIALPGRDSLMAAVRPAPGKTLYFVARGDGSHEFSETFEQHNAAVRRFQLRRPPPPRPEGGAS